MGTAYLTYEGCDTVKGAVIAKLSFRIDHGDRSHLTIPLAEMLGWKARYREAVKRRERGAGGTFLEIGQQMAAAIDGDKAFAMALDLPGHRPFEVVIPLDARSDPVAQTIEDLPWELLAPQGRPLAQNASQLFAVTRRHGEAQASAKAKYSDVALLFMAASPEGVNELDYEAEEAAILAATQPSNGVPSVHLSVDETGSLEGMVQSLRESRAEALHLSCHGGHDPKVGGFLAFESLQGNRAKVTAEQILAAIPATAMPKLAFVSACYTALRAPISGEIPGQQRAGEKDRSIKGLSDNQRSFHEPGAVAPLTRDDGSAVEPGAADDITRHLLAQIPNVVGWDGAVNDTEATLFTSVFYQSLGAGETVALAAARGRARLLRETFGDQPSADWHLARVHLNAHGGAPLCLETGGKARQAEQDATEEFLDPETQRVKVAPRREFVGRRREIQRILRAFAARERVLIRGMGNLGKSSVAARVAGRVRGLTPVVIFEHYGAESIFEAICKRLPAATKARLVAWQNHWKPQIAEDGALLEIALQELLEGVTTTGAAGTEIRANADILLIIDDLERALEEPKASEKAALGPRTDKMQVALSAVLRAFDQAQTQSRLLFTSRYDMALVDGSGKDLVSETKLTRVALTPMKARSREKQLRAFARAQGLEDGLTANALPWLERAADAAGGNPWIQRMLQEQILRGELASVEAAIEALEAYRRDGTPPKDGSEVSEFLAQQIIDRLGQALTEGQKRVLRACTVFSEGVPIPMAALEAVAAEAGAKDPSSALNRLRALGLLEPWGEIGNQPHAALNPLARGLTDPLDGAHSEALARAALPVITDTYANEDGDVPAVPAVRDAMAFAVLLKDSKSANQCAWGALTELQSRTQSIDTLAKNIHTWVPLSLKGGFNPVFLRSMVSALQYAGSDDLKTGHPTLRLLVATLEDADLVPFETDLEHCSFLMTTGRALENRYDAQWAEKAYRNLLLRSEHNDRPDIKAMAQSMLAGLRSRQGDHLSAIDEHKKAIELHKESGDEENLGTAHFALGEALLAAGQPSQAEKYFRDELSIRQEFNDQRAIAITKGK
ncbi:CHAT domain-containing protein, partial [Ruegeria sp. 2205SS24-7]|uniref:CHAT domain-containing protein n=1 Tax=Ruegeria discodermiae TaxID=3064389 RepID=UPI0027407568